MKLYYAPPSPFARIVRIALIETGLDARVAKQKVTLYPSTALLPFNPVGRVPTLELDDGTILSESLLILSYIDAINPGPKLLPRDGSDQWRTLAEMGTAMGLLDGIVTWSRMLRNPENQRATVVLEREADRVNHTADALDRVVSNGAYAGSTINSAQIVLGTALGWVEPRHPIWKWRVGRPALSAWHDKIAAAPSFRATVPPAS